MKALPNNNKPATHFIEVFKTDNLYHYSNILNISYLKDALLHTSMCKLTTIAIFKIRLK